MPCVGRRTKVVRGGSRNETFKRFTLAVRGRPADALPLLLADSARPVQAGHSPWQHLRARDDWNKPDETSEDQAFLMVQFMETWFLADKGGLRHYFCSGFSDQAIKQWPELEAVPKDTVLKALTRATAVFSKAHEKGKTSFELLAYIDPSRAKTACPGANALPKRLAAGRAVAEGMVLYERP